MLGRSLKHFEPFKEGDQVWLESKNLKLLYERKKIAPKRQGPFKILQVLGPLSYRLKLPVQWKIHDTFHACLLTPFKENGVHGPNYIRPPPDIINKEEQYEVEAILQHRRQGKGWKYFVKWKDYPSSKNSWEPVSHLTNAKDTLEAYKKRHKL